MTVTAPLTQPEAEKDEVEIIDPGIEIGYEPTDPAEEVSLLRDPLLPFIALGVINLVALVYLAYLASGTAGIG